MTTFSFISYAVSLFYLFLSIYILALNGKSNLNKVFFILTFGYFIWSLSYGFIHSETDIDKAFFWLKISSIAWGVQPGIILMFALLLTKKENYFKKLWVYILAFGPGIATLILTLSGQSYVTKLIRLENGWFEFKSPDSPTFILYSLYVISLISISFILIWKWGKTSTINREKMQAKVIVKTGFITLIIQSLFLIIIFNFNELTLPGIDSLSALIWIGGILYSTIKYRLMTTAPEIAVSNILSRIKDMIIITDTNGIITQTNKRVEELTGLLKEELRGINISKIIKMEQDNDKGNLLTKDFEKELNYKRKDGKVLPVNVSASVIKDEFDDRTGLIFIASDLRKTYQLNKELEEEITNRKKLEGYLKERLSVFSEFIDINPFHIAICNIKGNPIMLNKSLRNLIGNNLPRDYSFLTDKHIEKFNLQENLDKLKQGNVFEISELCYNPYLISPDYTDIEVCLHTLIIPIKDAKKNVVNYIVMLEDITERKNIERKLNEETAFIESILEYNPLCISIYDLNGNFIRGNPAYYKLIKISPPNNYSIFNDPVLIEKGFQQKMEEMKKGKVQYFEYILYDQKKIAPEFPDPPLHLKSVGFPIKDDDGNIAYYGVINEDISLQKEAQKENEYHAKLIANVSDAIISMDFNGIIQSWNAGAETIYGWKADEVIGKDILTVIYPEFIDFNIDKITKHFQIYEFWYGEIKAKRKNGEYINALSSINLINDERGNPWRVVAVNHDITKRKEAEQEMRKALKKEKELSDLKTRFINLASHEFKTPLSIIMLCANLLERHFDKLDMKKKTGYFRKIDQSIDQIDQLLNEILIIGKTEAGKITPNPEPIELYSFCDEIIEEIKMSYGLEREIKFIFKGKNIQRNFDRKLLRHILTNLLNNAIKYSPENKIIKFFVILHKHNTKFIIKDKGIGINHDDMPHIYDSFHRGKNVDVISGTGLGLTIVKRYVDLMNSRIDCKSKPGSGAIFTVTIPKIVDNIE